MHHVDLSQWWGAPKPQNGRGEERWERERPRDSGVSKAPLVGFRHPCWDSWSQGSSLGIKNQGLMGRPRFKYILRGRWLGLEWIGGQGNHPRWSRLGFMWRLISLKTIAHQKTGTHTWYQCTEQYSQVEKHPCEGHFCSACTNEDWLQRWSSKETVESKRNILTFTQQCRK